VTKLLSLLDIWNLYEREISATQPQEKAQATLSRTKTALLRYTMPGWGFVMSKGGKLTNWETEKALNYMKGIGLVQFEAAYQIQQEVFDLHQVPSNSQRTYRAALKKLLEWCEEQPWWLKSASISEQRFSSPKKQSRTAVDVRVTNRKYKNSQGELIQPFKYGLGSVDGETIPENLQKELDNYKRFRTEADSSYSTGKVRESTVEQELKQIRLILGWLYRHHYQGISLAEMSLGHIVATPSESNLDEIATEQANIAAKYTANLAYEYILWLKADPKAEISDNKGRGIESRYTEISVLKTFLLVAKFLRHDEISLVIRLLKNELAKIKQETCEHPIVRDESKKWLDWNEFLTLVEQLRKECNSRVLQECQLKNSGDNFGNLRSLTAIANSYQRFIFTALLSYLPPHRQQIYRQLELEHPSKYKNTDDRDEFVGISGCLFKEEDTWFIYLLSDTYQMERQYNYLKFSIPNIHYLDGRDFYQYLNEWMIEYTYRHHHGVLEKVDGLRQVFKPQHNFLFTKKNGRNYIHPTEFSNLLRIPACRISDRALTPTLLKRMFLTYIIKNQVEGIVLRDLTKSSSADLHDYDTWKNTDKIQEWLKIAHDITQRFVLQER
jgi:hypothetical protein